MFWISLKKTVMAFGKAYENPMEMKDPSTTAHPHPPSGGGTAGLVAGVGITGPTQCRFAERWKKKERRISKLTENFKVTEKMTREVLFLGKCHRSLGVVYPVDKSQAVAHIDSIQTPVG